MIRSMWRPWRGETRILFCALSVWVCVCWSSTCLAQWVVVKARVEENGTCLASDHDEGAGVTGSTYRIEEVLTGICTAAVVKVWCFVATVPKEGLPVHAVLFLEAPFFPYNHPMRRGMFAVDGDARLSIIPLHGGKGESRNETALVRQAQDALAVGHKTISLTEAGRIVAGRFAGKQIEVAIEGGRRYRRGWVVGVRATKSDIGETWMAVIDDEGVIHDLISGL
jgi:hypothetical protein